jgi:hypothetical protein
MALYVGETTRIKSEGTDFDGEPLTDTNVTSATLTVVLKSDLSVVVDEEDMTYDDDLEYWYYDWDTSGQDAGAYKARVTYLGATFETWEFKDFRLRVNPF